MAVLDRPYAKAIPGAAAPPPTAGARSNGGHTLPKPRRWWLVLAITLTVVIAVAPVVQTSGATETGYRMQQLERDRQTWNARIHQREAVIAGLSALPRVEQEARQLGLEPSQQQVYLEVPVAPPDTYHLPSRFMPDLPEVTQDDVPAWRRLIERLPIP
jgi:hypothetical protein